jgi:hypothetical protein
MQLGKLPAQRLSNVSGRMIVIIPSREKIQAPGAPA